MKKIFWGCLFVSPKLLYDHSAVAVNNQTQHVTNIYPCHPGFLCVGYDPTHPKICTRVSGLIYAANYMNHPPS